MTTIPTPVNLDPADTAKIAGLVAREQGLAKMTHDFQTQYEQRAAALASDRVAPTRCASAAPTCS